MNELIDFLRAPFTDPALAFAWQTTTTTAFVLMQFGVAFWLLVEILKRLPGQEKRKNFKLVHTERPFFNKEFLSELCWPMFNWVFMVPLNAMTAVFLVQGFLEPYVPKHSLEYLVVDLPIWAQVVIGTIVLDFALYLRHRFVHHFAWSYHTVHHAAREITWLTWIRLHPGDIFFMGIIDAIVLWLVGFEATAMVTAISIRTHVNQFNHSNIFLDYPAPLRYILVSPNMHRWHHAADDPKALNTNFCIIWAWIDVLFGTFYVPKGRVPTRYGVVDEEGNDVVGIGWVEQLLYPLRQHIGSLKKAGAWVVGTLRRGEAEVDVVPPPEATSGSAKSS